MTVEEKMKRVSVLHLQCKRHQIFREKREEAAKAAEAGRLCIEIGDSFAETDADAHEMHYMAAATFLARAKRLCRDVLRGRQ